MASKKKETNHEKNMQVEQEKTMEGGETTKE